MPPPSSESGQQVFPRFVETCQKCNNGNKVTVQFADDTWTFHAQWLHDARCDNGSPRNAVTAFCQQGDTIQVNDVRLTGHSVDSALEVTWKNNTKSNFPVAWLKALAPVVARPEGETKQSLPCQRGWTTDTLKIPEIPYNRIFVNQQSEEDKDNVNLSILSLILDCSSAGIVKITGLPTPNMEEEKNHKSVTTKILKHLFGTVWQHPKREADTTFNVASHNDDQKRANDLPNYDTNQVLLPHSDHAFYDNPIQVMGFYCLEGKSENTWVSSLAALETMKREEPELFKYLHTAPMALGRVSRSYGPPLFQGTLDTPVTLQPGSSELVKRLRWHPNLTGSILAPYDDYQPARLAHVKFQEIMRRKTHQLKIPFNPGDLYIWDNFRNLHGREQVLEDPRTGIGQTVPEAAVSDRYRELLTAKAKKYVHEDWLVHMPAAQLAQLVKTVTET
ncbi:MAG: hypothetical protein L6R39_002054 [Caloplaca ligustica]|nr:MAG: hypothetical protein L6R39_002054 [Caloplaca ligustica]